MLAFTTGTASASTVIRVNLFPISNGSTLTIADSSGEAPGQANVIGVGIAPEFPDDYRIVDLAGIDDPLPPFCVRESPTTIRCRKNVQFDGDNEPREVIEIVVLLGGMNDAFFVSGSGIPEGVLIDVDGGTGNDQITGNTGAGREELVGGPGDDLIVTGAPAENKHLDGGEGNDKIIVGGEEVLPPDPFRTDATPLAVASKSGPGAKLLGGAGNDKLTGGPDNDKLNGGPGKDKLKGGRGKDKLKCGGGKDSAVGGGGKDSAKGCESEKGVE